MQANQQMPKTDCYLFPTDVCTFSAPTHRHSLHVGQAVVYLDIQKKVKDAHFGEFIEGSPGEQSIELSIECFLFHFTGPAFDFVDALPKALLLCLQLVELLLQLSRSLPKFDHLVRHFRFLEFQLAHCFLSGLQLGHHHLRLPTYALPLFKRGLELLEVDKTFLQSACLLHFLLNLRLQAASAKSLIFIHPHNCQLCLIVKGHFCKYITVTNSMAAHTLNEELLYFSSLCLALSLRFHYQCIIGINHQIVITGMKFCTQCQQYHARAEGHSRSCFTYQKFTYLLKDEFMKRNKEEEKQPKQTQLSSHHQPKKEDNKVQRSKVEESNLQSYEKIVNSGVRHYQRTQENSLNRRIEKVINKSRGCLQYKKDCSHLRSTSCDEHLSSAEDQLEECPPLDNEKDMELTIIPCEKLFGKPYNSRLLANPIVYDSLYDNRICGANFCEEGEVYADSEWLARTRGAE